MTGNKYPKPQERMTKAHRAMLIKQLGFSASFVIDFSKLDFERGSMQTGPRERVFWTTDGKKVTVVLTEDGGTIASQSKEPDPELPDVAFPGYDGS